MACGQAYPRSMALRLGCVLAWLAAATLIVSGCGEGTSTARQDSPRDVPMSAPIYSAAEAKSLAEALLAALPLPPKTRRVPDPPRAATQQLERELTRAANQDFAREQERVAYWVSEDSPHALLRFVTAHAPEAAREYTSGYGGIAGRTEAWSEVLSVPTTAALAGPRELLILIVLAPRRQYAVRLDAVVAWHLRRPTNTFVASSARWLKASVTQRTSLLKSLSKRRTLYTVIATDPSVVHAVAGAVNALPLAEPAGPFLSCPAITQPPRFVHLTFRASASSPTLATVLVATDECSRGGEASAWIKLRHGSEVALTDHLALAVPREGMGLIEAVEAALSHRLHLL